MHSLDTEKIIEKVMESLDRVLVNAVATLSERQDKLEEKSSGMLDLLSSQITGLLLSVSTSPHHSSSINESLSHSALPSLPCSLCLSEFETLPALDSHIRASHPSLLCDLCCTTLRSQPDVNYH